MQSFVWGETYPAVHGRPRPLRLPPRRTRRPQPHVALHGHAGHQERSRLEERRLHHASLSKAFAAQATSSSSPAARPSRLQKNYPTRAQAEAYVDKIIAADIAHTDANDFLYYVNASRNYNPAPKLSTITAPVLWINSADDFINPPELGIAEKMVTQMPHARFILIPISDATRGHGTHTVAERLEAIPHRLPSPDREKMIADSHRNIKLA